MNAINDPTKRHPKRKRGKAAALTLPKCIVDTGAEFRFRRGHLTIEKRAADPDAPNRSIARPRVYRQYERLHDRGRLTKQQFDAAEEYLTLREIESGGKWVNGQRLQVSRALWDRTNATIEQMQASARLRKAHEIVGARARLVLTQLVVENKSVIQLCREYAPLSVVTRTRVPLDERVVFGWLDAALERLVEHWGLDGRRHA